MKAARTENEAVDEVAVYLVDHDCETDVGECARAADWGIDDSERGGPVGGVGVVVVLAVDALWHSFGWCWWLVDANSFWWLVVGVGGVRRTLVVGVGGWCW